MVAYKRSDDDTNRQERIARILEVDWDCYMHLPDEGTFKEYNYEATRDFAKEDPFAIVEIKCRNLAVVAFDTTWISLERKYKFLMEVREKTGLPTYFVVAWFFPNRSILQAIRYIEVGDIDASNTSMGGWTIQRAGTVHDRERMIDIPISSMKHIEIPRGM